MSKSHVSTVYKYEAELAELVEQYHMDWSDVLNLQDAIIKLHEARRDLKLMRLHLGEDNDE